MIELLRLPGDDMEEGEEGATAASDGDDFCIGGVAAIVAAYCCCGDAFSSLSFANGLAPGANATVVGMGKIDNPCGVVVVLVVLLLVLEMVGAET